MNTQKTEAKVCLTTLVYGELYQRYLIQMLFSIKNTYPNYDVVIFVYGALIGEIKQSLFDMNLLDNVKIVDHAFAECKTMTPFKSKALRWVLWDDSFSNYDYLYTVDIDMFYCPEPLQLHLQHAMHSEYLGLPFSNLRRIVNYSKFDVKLLLVRLKRAGLVGWLNFFFNRSEDTRLSGLHFVCVQEYYKRFDQSVRDRYRALIISGDIFKFIKYPNNEVVLAHIVESLGFDLSRVGLQSDSATQLDFNDVNRSEFRPHHGIHLGLFRRGAYGDFMLGDDAKVFETPAYRHYGGVLRELLENDDFKRMLEASGSDVTRQFELAVEWLGKIPRD